MVGLYQFLLEAVDNGKLLIIDELDIKLHAWVFCDFIKHFHDAENKKSQLIFSAHNPVALNREVLHIDELYFVEKDKQGKSLIARLNESSMSKDNAELMHRDFEKQYLDGRFGAIPPNELNLRRNFST